MLTSKLIINLILKFELYLDVSVHTNIYYCVLEARHLIIQKVLNSILKFRNLFERDAAFKSNAMF